MRSDAEVPFLILIPADLDEPAEAWSHHSAALRLPGQWLHGSCRLHHIHHTDQVCLRPSGSGPNWILYYSKSM